MAKKKTKTVRLKEDQTSKKSELQMGGKSLVGASAQPVPKSKDVNIDADTNKKLIDDILSSGEKGKSFNSTDLEKFTSISTARNELYKMIDVMAQDSSVNAIIRTYAENVCETGDNGHVIWCESSDPKISTYVNYLLNIANIDKNMHKWTYNLLKYGDIYLKLFRESDQDDAYFNSEKINSVAQVRSLNESTAQIEAQEALNEQINLSLRKNNDHYSGYVEMVDDPSTMFEADLHGKTYGYIEVPNIELGLQSTNYYNDSLLSSGNPNSYILKSNEINIYQADDFVHACLDDNGTRFPETVEIVSNESTKYSSTPTNKRMYKIKRGKSILQDSYKSWREKSLLENATLLSKLSRANVLNIVNVEVGNTSKDSARAMVRHCKNIIEQKTSLDANRGMSEYNDPAPTENYIYSTTRDGKGAISLDRYGGDINIKDIADLEWWNNKFYSNYGIPKQYFGWTEDGAGFNGGTSLTILSSVFYKGVKCTQDTMIQLVTDIINFFLLDKGCKSFINNFVLKMKRPVSQEELDYRDNLSNKISSLASLQGLLTDIEDRSKRLEATKVLVSTLGLGDEIVTIIQKEIVSAKEQKKKAEEEEAKKKAEEEKANQLSADMDAKIDNTQNDDLPENPDFEPAEMSDNADEISDLSDLNLPPMPDSELPMESFAPKENLEPLTENQNIPDTTFTDMSENMPLPEELDSSKDFSDNLDFRRNK